MKIHVLTKDANNMRFKVSIVLVLVMLLVMPMAVSATTIRLEETSAEGQ